jgi:Fur family ferric uptake transcriptional regulator
MPEKITRRNTQQRRVLLEELRKLKAHPTAAELHTIARRRVPKLSLATVYRNLELLARMGIIRKIKPGGSQARFDGDPDRHYHARCIQCGRVDDVRGLAGDQVKPDLSGLGDYEVLYYHVEFVGLCPRCTPGHPQEPPTDQTGGPENVRTG